MEEKRSSQNNPLGYAPLSGLMRKFAIPSIISMLVNSLYNMTDQIFIGHMVGMLGNAATNVAFPLTMLMIAFAQLIGVGTSANLNISLGAKKEDEATRAEKLHQEQIEKEKAKLDSWAQKVGDADFCF